MVLEAYTAYIIETERQHQREKNERETRSRIRYILHAKGVKINTEDYEAYLKLKESRMNKTD